MARGTHGEKIVAAIESEKLPAKEENRFFLEKLFRHRHGRHGSGLIRLPAHRHHSGYSGQLDRLGLPQSDRGFCQE